MLRRLTLGQRVLLFAAGILVFWLTGPWFGDADAPLPCAGDAERRIAQGAACVSALIDSAEALRCQFSDDLDSDGENACRMLRAATSPDNNPERVDDEDWTPPSAMTGLSDTLALPLFDMTRPALFPRPYILTLLPNQLAFLRWEGVEGALRVRTGDIGLGCSDSLRMIMSHPEVGNVGLRDISKGAANAVRISVADAVDTTVVLACTGAQRCEIYLGYASGDLPGDGQCQGEE